MNATEDIDNTCEASWSSQLWAISWTGHKIRDVEGCKQNIFFLPDLLRTAGKAEFMNLAQVFDVYYDMQIAWRRLTEPVMIVSACSGLQPAQCGLFSMPAGRTLLGHVKLL